MKSVYPVIFTQTEESVLIEVTDLKIVTEGKDMIDAIDAARDAIGLKVITMEDNGIEIPPPSDLDQINLTDHTFAGEGKSYSSLVDIDFSEYRRRVDNKTIRRNVTLPNWLNLEAEKAHLNVSKVLQEALVSRLGQNN